MLEPLGALGLPQCWGQLEAPPCVTWMMPMGEQCPWRDGPCEVTVPKARGSTWAHGDIWGGQVDP